MVEEVGRPEDPDEEVLVAVVVVVAEGRAPVLAIRRQDEAQSRHVAEGAVAAVAEEHRLRAANEKDVLVAIAIVIADGEAGPGRVALLLAVPVEDAAGRVREEEAAVGGFLGELRG